MHIDSLKARQNARPANAGRCGDLILRRAHFAGAGQTTASTKLRSEASNVRAKALRKEDIPLLYSKEVLRAASADFIQCREQPMGE